ncbi:hypothetical protein J6524_20715 [Bradyrhizobium sp. WSM 1738]|uniref:hypothetical protein n=1 Tax=Bradyrhizobium hereditatis TaxID=2821405 RepID=UPI001CE335B3|nr:hypothetical protein [Bradyrhizobium hereditatis]MCA6117275.1 hypothetical protein [Bradyrhizobium hereditatis]
MNWAWAASLDQIWQSPNLPLYLTLATAGFVGIVVLITLLRAERSVANGVLALITLLAIGVAGTVAFRGSANVPQQAEARPVQMATAPLPQLACIDELAGDAVLAACEKVLFGSAESVAAAVAYAASQITLLTSLGDVATANKGAGSDLLALRRAVERDRYGLMAYVLTVRDRCTPSSCRAFRSLTETRQIASNMEDRVYESLIMRYAASWNAPAPGAAGLIAALPPSMPTGKPTNAEFPTSASTPAVSIMTPEPPAKPSPPAAAAPASPPAPRPATAATPPAPAPSPAVAAAKKSPPPAPKRPSTAPVPLAPSASPPATSENE